MPTVNQIDTLAAEYPASTNYLDLSYLETEIRTVNRKQHYVWNSSNIQRQRAVSGIEAKGIAHESENPSSRT